MKSRVLVEITQTMKEMVDLAEVVDLQVVKMNCHRVTWTCPATPIWMPLKIFLHMILAQDQLHPTQVGATHKRQDCTGSEN